MSTIKKADHIIVMEKGYIVERGTHDELLKNSKVYENLYKKQLPLTVVKPGNQTRSFTHINDTIAVCFEAWKKN